MLNNLFIREVKIDKHNEDNYVYSLPAIRNLDSIKFNKKVTFIVGENGSGKSTLLEAIAVNCGFNPEGGTKNFNFSTSDTHSPLYEDLIVVKSYSQPQDGFFLRAESFYNVATEIDELDKMPFCSGNFLANYGGVSLHKQSHGESFMALMLNRFSERGLYILDEPEAALSPSRQLSMLARINQLVEENCQFIIATHSPILMAYPDADIFVIEDSEIGLKEYEETEHYIITKQFLNNPRGMLRHLLEED